MTEEILLSLKELRELSKEYMVDIDTLISTAEIELESSVNGKAIKNKAGVVRSSTSLMVAGRKAKDLRDKLYHLKREIHSLTK